MAARGWRREGGDFFGVSDLVADLQVGGVQEICGHLQQTVTTEDEQQRFPTISTDFAYLKILNPYLPMSVCANRFTQGIKP